MVTRYVPPLQLDSHSLCPSQPEKVVFKPYLHYWLVDGGNLDSSVVQFCHNSSSHRHQNEEAMHPRRLEGTLNDQHQSGGR